MKLSEAIRLGALLKPQGFGMIFRQKTGESCAIGAALDAIGRLPFATDESSAYRHWPILYRTIEHPIHYHLETDVLNAITDLNDEERWTREQIADWVDTIEAQHESPAAHALVSVEVRADGEAILG
jgi:hypothetical protein